MFIHTVVTFLLSIFLGPAVAAQHVHPAPPSPPSSTATSALTAETVAQLLNGDGMGLAKPAELNHYPGPKHVLELKKELAITPEQEQRVEAIRRQMLERAQAIGKRIVELEQALDGAFKAGRITEADLAQRVSEGAKLQGELRTVHLQAHLVTKPVLTPEQVAQYYQLRGGHAH